MLSAINNVKVSHGHWKTGASDLDLFEVRFLSPAIWFLQGPSSCTIYEIHPELNSRTSTLQKLFSAKGTKICFNL